MDEVIQKTRNFVAKYQERVFKVLSIKQMKRLILAMMAIISCLSISAADSYTVTITYDGSSATVSIPSAISSYVSCSSGSSSHVRLIQKSTATSNPGEIIYQLSGSSSDGEFYMEGEFKATLLLNGLTLTNPDSTAINILDGKRVKVSLASGTENTIADGTKNADSKGCFRCKGHTEFVGKGTLNVKSNFHHAIYSKEYIELKNCTINVTGAKKDAIHCKQYFRMSSGVVNISQADDDGIQVELKGDTPTSGSTSEDEDTGNFYMAGGTLTINNVGKKCIKTDGTITYTGGTQDFDKTNTQQHATSGIAPTLQTVDEEETLYDLQGRQLPKGVQPKGIYIIKGKNKTEKRISY